ALWEDESIADSITTHAVQFIEQNKSKPFFLYFGTNDIHVPRYPHPRFVGKTDMRLRGDAIVQFDYSVGEVIKVLERCGIRQNARIVNPRDMCSVEEDGDQDEAVQRRQHLKP